jgi:hypothetical protein
MISASSFYSEFHGHRIEHLQMILDAIRRHDTNETTRTSILWTAGDSSLDNKYWFRDTVPAISHTVYSELFQPPVMKPDVTYWLNELLVQQQQQQQQCQQNQSLQQQPMNPNEDHSTSATTTKLYVAINTAVEATTLNERTFHLREQDIFIRDHIQPNDILIVSIGGNDIAMSPLCCTICSIVSLIYCIPTVCLQHQNTITATACYTIPYDDSCYGCGWSLLSCCSTPFVPCLGYFYHMFRTRVQLYIERLTMKNKPTHIVIGTIYYPDEYSHQSSWANLALSCLQYNTNPNKVQTLLQTIHYHATSNISINHTHVIPIAFYILLNGTIRTDYIQRVEPSPSGGKKMAQYILQQMGLLPIQPQPHQQPMEDTRPTTPTTLLSTNATSVDRPRHHHLEHYHDRMDHSCRIPYQSFMTDRE